MKIIIAGDLVLLKEYNSDCISQEIKNIFLDSDFNIINLEAPITESDSKIVKTGPHIKANQKSTLETLKALRIDMVTLANNHILDYGEKGVIDTLAICKENAIETIGAGNNRREASNVHYLETPQGKIAFLNFAENEWASATENTAGANGMDLIDNTNQIRAARGSADWVIVIVHGGHEHYQLPSPRMQKQYRFYIDNGADLVVGHHPHCISGMETYKGKNIYYSLGNFLFQMKSNFEGWYKGAFLEISITNRKLATKISFVSQKKESFKLSMIDNVEIQNEFQQLSSVIITPQSLDLAWNEFVLSRFRSTQSYWSPLNSLNNRYLKRIFFKLNLSVISRATSTLFLNLIRCEAHRDLSIEFFKKRLAHKRDREPQRPRIN